MHDTHVVGVDPGLVHTGVVSLFFKPAHQHITVSHEAVVGPNAQGVHAWIEQRFGPAPYIFIEDYKPRSHYGTDTKMLAAVADCRRETGGTVLLNTGVKKVVKRPLMELLGCWNFSTATHHQDLRSAARIALLGMLKSHTLNEVLTAVVRDHLEGRAWHVHQS